LKTKNKWFWILGFGLVSVLIAALVWFSPLRDYFLDPNLLSAWLSGLGKWAPFITIGLHILQVISAPIPGTAIDAVNGYLFGPWLGTLYSMTGLILGSILVMSAVRKFGKPLADRLYKSETFEWLNFRVQKYGRVFIFLFFLLPFVPDDVICILAGLTNIPLLELFLLAIIGRTPGVFIANWLGSQAGELTFRHWIFIGVLAILAIFFFWRYQDLISRKIIQINTRLSAWFIKKP
jgi:uncharacterized membrane protein YdjX (TVP38/TMEM64 family)